MHVPLLRNATAIETAVWPRTLEAGLSGDRRSALTYAGENGSGI